MKTAKHEKVNIVSAVLSLCLSSVLVICSSFAWFSFFTPRQESTKAIEVQEPPILYILDSDATDIMQLSLSGLKIGETKRLVFCVSSIYPVENDSYGFKGPFSLQLVYTNNLSANYTLYPATIGAVATPDSIEYISQAGTTAYFTPNSTPLTGINVSETGNNLAYGTNHSAVQEKNNATYMKYISTDDDTMPNSNLWFRESIAGTTGMFNTLNCRFFVLEITWGDTSTVDSKETDMIYIIAKGGVSDD